MELDYMNMSLNQEWPNIVELLEFHDYDVIAMKDIREMYITQ